MNTIHRFLQRHLPIYKWLLLRVFLVIFILLVFYAIFLYLGFINFFNGALSQGATLLGCRALSASLIKIGFPASLTLCLFWGVKALLTTLPETVHMVSPRGGDGQALPLPGPSDPSSSSLWKENSPEPVPAAAVDPYVYQPLLTDEIRKQELGDRLRINVIGKGYRPELVDSMVETQVSIEKKIEQALLSDGYSRDSLIENRHKIRGFALYPHGKALSGSTYRRYLSLMENYGTHRSGPYKGIMDAIFNLDLFLSK